MQLCKIRFVGGAQEFSSSVSPLSLSPPLPPSLPLVHRARCVQWWADVAS